ncbi:hypothetical protein HBI56_009030 [Parastagonospora nodorum]|uniref:Zn(2)-C6 fungal-type domain-containing protein n=2 Tax=Phaeosphaeria nodorum (strain SN15 / ATCC MYA-4574 / FGSC 10173) TaxID=321614 RepID=A0A7U2ES12_PHANO|nr:hypothetical protein HBH56_236500 [Parastagonospora nodorum]QRC90918.1 hypothetical protein JI435_004330 [Parastagonospora nodorum SN15]KAH3935142.1 hypothetical protein HBH54_046230 [Parastagonospora nodorum]KAH3950287.1 hypothetical protein HBH53_077730 [Parastagonospora nodorum]KAH3986990.1 hypothetical protein HBH51_010780 [Parastagonospora nodorum]
MTAMRKRNRACQECHQLKIKCDVSTSPGGACERCSRNNVECVPAAPRLQRDRINQLEAEVEELRNALRDQSSSATPSRSPGSLLDNYEHNMLTFLDARIRPSKQQELLSQFAHQAGAAWPVLHLPMDLDLVRTKSPILLLSVLVYSVTQETQGTELEVHDELVRETMHILGDELIGRGQRSLELVQALLVAAFWNKTTRKGQQGSCYQLIQLATDMAIDLGVAGPSLQPSPVAYFDRHQDPSSLDARRTWLACFVALSTSSISTRRSNPVPWDSHLQDCVQVLESKGGPSDVLLCQLVRITQLIEDIIIQMCLCQTATFIDGNDYHTHATMEPLRIKVDAWAARVPASLASSLTLKVWYHVAMILLHEAVLHTPTNKSSFAAPFIPGRVAVKDFPKPTLIIPPLQPALVAIVQHCQAVIDTAADMDPVLVLSLPSFCFAPTVLYALFVLVNVFVAATDPTNTYGECLSKDDFRIEDCGLKLRRLTASMRVLDPTMSCYTTRMFDATSWLEDWYKDYTAILWRYEQSLAIV